MTARFLTLLLVPLFATLIGPSAPALAGTECEAPADALRYRVLWGGDDIGSHELAFSNEGDALIVRSRTEIDADIMFVDVLDLRHRGEEVWRNGRMESFRGHTVDNDAVFDVAVESEGDGYRLTRNGSASHIPAESIPGSLWCEALIGPPGDGLVIDLVKGRLRQVRIGASEPSHVKRGGQTIAARHVRISGGYDRELWFYEFGTGLRARFPAKMGPYVTLELQAPGLGPVGPAGTVDPAGTGVINERRFGK